MTLEEYTASVKHLVGQQFMRWWHADFIGDLRIRRMDDDVRGAYAIILSLAACSEVAPGALVDDFGEPLLASDIARDTGLRLHTVKRFLAAAVERDILRGLEGGQLYFPAFAGRQLSRQEFDKQQAFKASQSAKGKASAAKRAEKAARAERIASNHGSSLG